MVELLRVCLESVPSAVVRSSFRDILMYIKSTSIYEKKAKGKVYPIIGYEGRGGVVLLFL
jgi:hypothetical protein